MTINSQKISIITAVYNCGDSIETTIQSVLSQCYPNIEYIVIDGLSTDETPQIIDRYRDQITKVVTEADTGIYNALNKGLSHATGDIIGFLHADDFFASDSVLSLIGNCLEDQKLQACFGDLTYVDREDTNKVHRYWKNAAYDVRRFNYGWMPPHPTCYIRKQVYDQFGGFDESLSFAADYELLLRLMVKNKISVKHIPELLVNMRVGGLSNASWKNRLSANREDLLAWKKNELRAPFGLRLMKPLRKIGQVFFRRRNLAKI